MAISGNVKFNDDLLLTRMVDKGDINVSDSKGFGEKSIFFKDNHILINSG